MKGHCACQATGLSSHAIARAFKHCTSGGTDHPHDPSDLLRCLNYCAETSIGDAVLARTMSPVSPQWAVLTAHWATLRDAARIEEPTGNGEATYRLMKLLLRGDA